jgi:hypothetical protein
MEGWKELLIAGLGGGAVQELLDQFIARFIPGQFAGVQLKDIASIFLFKHLGDRVSGDWRTLCQGAALIALYKAVYPAFVKPLLSGVFGVAGATTTTTTTAQSPSDRAALAAQSYIAGWV